MVAAENGSRKNRKPGPGADRLANAARLKVLETALGVPIKRHKDPGNVVNTNPFSADREGTTTDKDESIVVMRGF